MVFSSLLFQRRQWHPTPVLLPGKSHGRRSLVGCSPWCRWESDTTERLHFHFSLSCIGEGNGNPLQCSCLENPRDGGAWWAAVYGVAQSRTQLKQFSSSSSSEYYGEGDGTPLQYSCLEKSHGWRRLVGCSPWDRYELDTTERLPFFTFHFNALEKKMATHSSVLAWRIPGTAEPGGLPSMGSYRVGHDWSDLAAAAAVSIKGIYAFFLICFY